MRDRDADLELPRHVGAPAERLFRAIGVVAVRAVPDLAVGACLVDRAIARLLSERIDFGVQFRQTRVDRAHHAPGVAAAGRLGVEQDVAQALDGRAQVMLHNLVKLEGLPRRQPQRLAAISTC